MEIKKIIGMEGGHNGTWYRVIAEIGRGQTSYYPAIKNGKEASMSDFASWDEYCKHKIKCKRETIRVCIAGNAVCAEIAIGRTLRCKALAVQSNIVDIYPEQKEKI